MASTGPPAGPTPGRGTEQAPRAGEDVDIRTRSVLLQKGRPRPQAHSGAGRHAEKQMPENIKDRTVWQSWLNLKPRVRIAFGVGFAALSIAGLMLADKLESKMPAPDSDKEKKPRGRLLGISVVDRPEEKTKKV
ncbi:hypothetical protein FA10DRAFT_267690 [Acaromyces ingoldii]|uniref:Uncharacterized protein n=1 Tax=Acaromyces ingoldii TaxID=215250 RepID=A0A316YJ45_9BASI|nr:hypothetical protein FA10DRAFT_267690 [Acaromyces ingoldii]PWN89086.1 hypothetical protein FA10DRAFT_267690 [Acaromyces ingoldii]